MAGAMVGGLEPAHIGIQILLRANVDAMIPGESQDIELELLRGQVLNHWVLAALPKRIPHLGKIDLFFNVH